MPYENMSVSITRPTAENYHALLFVGVCNRQRYVQSLIRWTNLLNQMFGYPLANIRILVGTYSNPAWDPMVAGTDVTYDVTRADLDNALAAYATGSGDPHELGANDNLFIFTFNHGGSDATGSYLCCENFATEYYASDFATRIGAIQCRQIVLLAAQCRAGGFVDPFIGGLAAGTQGAVIAGSRSDQDTMEAVCDKLFASAFNGRMVQDPLDDNIDIGITGEGLDYSTIPGYDTARIDWGPTGVLSTREAFNWVYEHYVNKIYSDPAYASIIEIPLYRQSPWTESGQPLHIRLGEPDLVMQDCAGDSGAEPSACASPWHSPDVYPDNTDMFPGAAVNEYVPAHHNRFFTRTANRGTAPADNIWRNLEVRGLGFTGGPVGPPRIDRAVEATASGSVPARLRPGRAHTQYEHILIGGDFGHGCVSAASFCGVDPMDHSLWSIVNDNDQAQCNLNPAVVSGSASADSTSVNSNAGTLVRTIPVLAAKGGLFEIRVGRPTDKLPVKIRIKKRKLELRKGMSAEFLLEIQIPSRTPDGLRSLIPVSIVRGKEVIGGVTFQIETATAYANAFVHDHRGLPLPKVKVFLKHPGDPRVITAVTDKKGIAGFGPLNPGFYFAEISDELCAPVRVHIVAGGRNRFKIEKGGC
jgi:hypothetical protein